MSWLRQFSTSAAIALGTASMAFGQGGAVVRLYEFDPRGVGTPGASVADLSGNGQVIAGVVSQAGTTQRFSFIWRPDEVPTIVIGNSARIRDGRVSLIAVAEAGQPTAISSNGSFIARSLTAPASSSIAGVYQAADNAFLYAVPSFAYQGGRVTTIRRVLLNGDLVAGNQFDPMVVFIPTLTPAINSAFLFHRTEGRREIPWTAPSLPQAVTWVSFLVDTSADGSRVLLQNTERGSLPGLPPVSNPLQRFDVVTLAGGQVELTGGIPQVLSGDGTTAAGLARRVGAIGFNNVSVPAIWEGTRLVRLALPPGGVSGGLTSIGGSGEVAAGWYVRGTSSALQPLLWIKARGTRDLMMTLGRHNVILPPGVTLGQVRHMSDDGRSMAGFAWGAQGRFFVYRVTLPASEVCYANCDGSTGAGGSAVLTAADVECFQRRLAAQQFYTDCNKDGQYDAADMACFMARFNAGCGN